MEASYCRTSWTYIPGTASAALSGGARNASFLRPFHMQTEPVPFYVLIIRLPVKAPSLIFSRSRLTNLPGRCLLSEEIPLSAGSIAPPSGLPLLKFRLIAGVFFYVHVFKPASLPFPAFLSIISHFGHGLFLLCPPHFNAARPLPLTYRKSAGRSVILSGAYLHVSAGKPCKGPGYQCKQQQYSESYGQEHHKSR